VRFLPPVRWFVSDYPRCDQINQFTLLLLAASFIASAAIADEEKPLEEIIVSAAPLDRSADDLTQSAIVLTKEDLLLKAEASIGETLANELGVSSTYFGPFAGRPVIRGQAGPRVSVLEGGISALDISDLSPDHAVSIEPLFADRIEVLRGPATLLYGSSACGGVVNVIDNRIPESLTDNVISGALELRGNTAAEERTALSRLDGSTGRVAWHLDAVSRQTDDIDIPDFATADPSVRPVDEERGTVLNSSGESIGYAGGISVVGDKGFIGVSLSAYENDYGLPGPEEEEFGAASEPNGAEHAVRNAGQAVRNGIAYFGEDRQSMGLFPGKSLLANMMVPGSADIKTLQRIDHIRERDDGAKLVEKLSIRCENLAQDIRQLSGGNQQKALIARWLHRDSDILLLDEPTRGVDVGTKNAIYDLLISLRQKGKTIIMASSEIDELTTVCDRILVLSDRKLVRSFERNDFSEQDILAAAFSEFTASIENQSTSDSRVASPQR